MPISAYIDQPVKPSETASRPSPDARPQSSVPRLRRLHILRYRFGYGKEHQIDPIPAANSIAAQLSRLNSGLDVLARASPNQNANKRYRPQRHIERCRQQIVPTEGFRNPVQVRPIHRAEKSRNRIVVRENKKSVRRRCKTPPD